MNLQKSWFSSKCPASPLFCYDCLENYTLDKKSNFLKICLVQICCRYEIPVATGAKVAMAEFAQKQANSVITTFALGVKLCKVHICNIFPQGKFYANLFFCPVIHKRIHYYKKYENCLYLPGITYHFELFWDT